MKVWLKKIQPPKYLRYFFFIIYRWYSSYSSEKPTAHYTAAIFLAIPHTFIYILICSLYNVQRISKGNMLLFIGFILVLHYYLFFYKAKWKGFLKEFKHLDKKKRGKGTYFVFLYLIFCFFIAIYSTVIRSNENSDSYKLEASRSNGLDTYGIAKCVSIQKENSSNFVFFEFYIDDRKVLGTTNERFNKTIGHTMEKISPVFGNLMNETIQFNINTTIETIKKKNSEEKTNSNY
ncbi:hypothetical protein [Zobellia sp. 1_MG-2023]|uniref:hypothetical protein n=1 Tax=Zobellia sp. 1_MG-2023 TaxID=3062626 RepID=UPI0026E1D768|nr:hypothetical protein [Zobellia sp. 1_MG-2023]MDO6818981.1 hypothetical protein [Zobellia sp. 1_MG-2023]